MRTIGAVALAAAIYPYALGVETRPAREDLTGGANWRCAAALAFAVGATVAWNWPGAFAGSVAVSRFC